MYDGLRQYKIRTSLSRQEIKKKIERIYKRIKLKINDEKVFVEKQQTGQ